MQLETATMGAVDLPPHVRQEFDDARCQAVQGLRQSVMRGQWGSTRAAFAAATRKNLAELMVDVRSQGGTEEQEEACRLGLLAGIADLAGEFFTDPYAPAPRPRPRHPADFGPLPIGGRH